MGLVVRTRVKPESIVPAIRHIFRELDPGLPLREPLTMAQVVADVLVFERPQNWFLANSLPWPCGLPSLANTG